MKSIAKKIFLNVGRNKENGQVALFIAVSVTSFLLYIGLYALNKVSEEYRSIGDSADSIEAFYLADTGAERFLYELKSQVDGGSFISLEGTADGITNGTANPQDIENGSYVIVGDGGSIKISGRYGDINRAIELNYFP